MLVVEDEAMVAMLVEDMLTDLGCVVVEIAGSVEQGLRLIAPGTIAFDAAILDVNIGGEKVFPVADHLATQGIPFLFATGYGPEGIAPRFAGRPVLAKPFRRAALETMLMQAIV